MGVHADTEGAPITENIPDHPGRTDSPEYVRSRATMNELAHGVDPLFYGPGPWEDHHGGACWLKDSEGWFLVKNLAGVEWSSQFAADPVRFDALRVNARRLYAAFPAAVAELGIRSLLDTPITDAAGVEAWTDSICNASVPLPKAMHTGKVTAHTAGVHSYPQPIVDIAFYARADFQLFVPTGKSAHAAVVPMAPRGSGDGRVQVIYATPGSAMHRRQQAAHAKGEPLVLSDAHHVSRQAFAKQT